MQRTVRLLLEQLNAHSMAQWKDRGEFVHKGITIRGSDVVNLVRQKESEIPDRMVVNFAPSRAIVGGILKKCTLSGGDVRLYRIGSSRRSTNSNNPVIVY